ncbi:extracellular solute-binding protein [Arthrobacter bambusae]|uniref:ABC transporter substrate-binding protein n=1 Tax=Arthrobacter bambusae TaxID=1338426 RepID=UPI001F50C2B3|nr:extracellular solute-binding protein [Arthrobacter bambusae]MCI0144079.1 extracellular solute-binding protein [Arthrobacter bambusae]
MKIGAKTLLAASVASLSLVLAGCAGTPAAEGNNSSTPCGASGTVNWYTTQDKASAQKLVDAFTAKCKVSVVLQTTQALPLLQRFQQEQAAGVNQADVFSVVGYGLAQTVIQGDLVTKLPPEVVAGFPSRFIMPDGYTFSTRVITSSITVNTKLVPAGQEPKSWADLKDPKWQGKIGLLDPTKNSGAYQTYWQLMNNKDLGPSYIDALATQKPVLYATSNQQVQAVESGEKAIAITTDDASYIEMGKGAPLKVIVPTEGDATALNFNMLVKTAPNPSGAKALLTFLASKDASKVSSVALSEYSPWPDIPGFPAERKPFSDVKLLDVDQAKQAEQQPDLSVSILKKLGG